VPKTLMQHLIRWVIASGQFGARSTTSCTSMLDTEISPELVPGRRDGKPQSTEDSIGPYALQDFTLYHVLRHGYPPRKIAFLAWHAWRDAGGRGVAAWVPRRRARRLRPGDNSPLAQVFVKRFATNQFKRSAMPNGPRSWRGGSLSPRGDWRMPSDANARSWLADIEANVPQS
jgi:NAD+ synthase (glutamine-hydrolysing)